MAKQTFTTGQVLTAAQMTSLQQTAMGGGEATAKTASYVLVAADAGTTVIMNAAGATTITVNTALFAAGDTVNIQNIGAGICTVTAGTATVNTAGSLALNQYEGGVLYFRSTSAATFFDYVQTGSVSPLTTKGDLYTFSTLDARLGVGANGTVLTAASGEATGLSWAAPGGMTLLETITFAGAATYTSASISGAYKDLKIYVKSFKPSTDAGQLNMRINADSGANYNYDAGTNGATVTPGNTSFPVTYTNDNSVATGLNVIQIDDYASAQLRHIFLHGAGNNATTTTDINTWVTYGIYKTTTAITSLTFFAASGNLTSGTVQIYGVK
jgi:hypothetical protein